MDLDLKDKVAIVTGAGSQKGFGRTIAVTLAREGCCLVLADIDIEGAEKTAGEVRSLGSQAIAVKVDIRNSREVKQMVEVALDKFGKIDILVNNAGAATPPKLFIDTNEDEWDFNIDLNLKGMLRCTKAVLDYMVPRKSGKIINLSSFGAKTGGENTTVYAAAKAGILSFTKGLSTEVRPLGINVNAVAPGVGLTNFVRDAPREILNELIQKTPARRTTTPEDIAMAVAYFASDVSSDVVGQTLSVDGGLT
jgi:NAD(P)-dependent dehydrogenase (short-subunit alcohol dehydrogenase family)